jgi:hypothetical protein
MFDVVLVQVHGPPTAGALLELILYHRARHKAGDGFCNQHCNMMENRFDRGDHETKITDLT